jgi:hypothetical protein
MLVVALVAEAAAHGMAGESLPTLSVGVNYDLMHWTSSKLLV